MTTAVPQIAKTQFRNNLDGWLGAVQVTAKGEERGIAIEPGGTVWLSEPEQILTANAPRRPEDNPFIEQAHVRVDPTTGAREEVKITPLVPISENRYVPANERPIPAMTPVESEAVAEPAPEPEPESEPAAAPTAPKLPSRARAAAQAAERAEEERAAQVDPQIGEETGAARPPAGPAPEGQYTAAEEVGTPDAPAAPAPYAPPGDEE